MEIINLPLVGWSVGSIHHVIHQLVEVSFAYDFEPAYQYLHLSSRGNNSQVDQSLQYLGWVYTRVQDLRNFKIK